MRKLYGKTTLAIYSEGEFFRIPIWMLENEFELETEELNIQKFIELPLDKKTELQNDVFREMLLYHSEHDIQPMINEARLNYAYCKMYENEYLVLPLNGEISAIDKNTLGEIYQDSELYNVENFLKESDEIKLQHCEVFKADCIYHDSKENWNIFKTKVDNFYNSQIEKDKAYYGKDYE